MSSRVNARPGGLILYLGIVPHMYRRKTDKRKEAYTGFPHDTFEKKKTILKRDNIAHSGFLKRETIYFPAVFSFSIFVYFRILL